MTTPKCHRCHRTLYPTNAWTPNIRGHCNRCYHRAKVDGTLTNLPTTEERIEDLEWLLDTGGTFHEIVRHAGTKPASLYRLFYRHGRTDLWAKLQTRNQEKRR